MYTVQFLFNAMFWGLMEWTMFLVNRVIKGQFYNGIIGK